MIALSLMDPTVRFPMPPIIEINSVSKTYDKGPAALSDVNLAIDKGEILALLGPNGAGKTTLISIICGLVTMSAGTIRVGGHDIVDDFRAARALIGLVPQEIVLEPFETVLNTVRFSRGLFGLPNDPARLEEVLRQLSLWDKRDARIRTLSGGMKRRVLIAKALSHDPQVLFLDEPSAGVDVELRKDMWEVVRGLAKSGVTIVLTTHYIEEAEEMADRVGVISKGRILLVEQTETLMQQMGRKELRIELRDRATRLPAAISDYGASLSDDGMSILYAYDTKGERPPIAQLLADMEGAGLKLVDVRTRQSSLEEIFVDLVKEPT